MLLEHLDRVTGTQPSERSIVNEGDMAIILVLESKHDVALGRHGVRFTDERRKYHREPARSAAVRWNEDDPVCFHVSWSALHVRSVAKRASLSRSAIVFPPPGIRGVGARIQLCQKNTGS